MTTEYQHRLYPRDRRMIQVRKHASRWRTYMIRKTVGDALKTLAMLQQQQEVSE